MSVLDEYNGTFDAKEDERKRLELVKDIPLDRLSEICGAEKDDRLVILPCKIGTPVYRILHHCECAAMDDEAYDYVCQFPESFTLCMLEDFGKTVFLTREEAEAKLKEAQHGN